MAQSTTYHQTLKCSPSEIVHGRVLYDVLDFKFGKPLQPPRGRRDIKTLVYQVNRRNKINVDNIFDAFFEHKEYPDREGQASPLIIDEYVFLLNLKYINQFCQCSIQSSALSPATTSSTLIANMDSMLTGGSPATQRCQQAYKP